MKRINSLKQVELAVYVQTHLRAREIDVVLSGGAAVTIYSSDKYVSQDIDLINIYSVARKKIKSAMEEIGFREVGRHFEHPNTQFLVEFPPGPLAVGQEPVKKVDEIKYETGILKVISPTDCVKDRLSAYYHWGDHQCLSQAILVSKNNKIDMEEIRRWSKTEGKSQEFELIRGRLMKKATTRSAAG
jgi:hypothetical protein